MNRKLFFSVFLAALVIIAFPLASRADSGTGYHTVILNGTGYLFASPTSDDLKNGNVFGSVLKQDALNNNSGDFASSFTFFPSSPKVQNIYGGSRSADNPGNYLKRTADRICKLIAPLGGLSAAGASASSATVYWEDSPDDDYSYMLYDGAYWHNLFGNHHYTMLAAQTYSGTNTEIGGDVQSTTWLSSLYCVTTALPAQSLSLDKSQINVGGSAQLSYHYNNPLGRSFGAISYQGDPTLTCTPISVSPSYAGFSAPNTSAPFTCRNGSAADVQGNPAYDASAEQHSAACLNDTAALSPLPSPWTSASEIIIPDYCTDAGVAYQCGSHPGGWAYSYSSPYTIAVSPPNTTSNPITYTYTFTCSNANDATTRTASLTVNPSAQCVGQGNACSVSSDANSCGQTNTANGTITCSGTTPVCSATKPAPPPDSNCPAPGVCAATHYRCTAGTSANNVNGATAYTWNCNGTNGGATASCSELKPTVRVSVIPSAVSTSQSFSVKMTSTNATSCTWTREGSYSGNWANQAVPAPNTSYDSGNLTWAAGNATWTFTCTNAAGSASGSGSVTVTNGAIDGACGAASKTYAYSATGYGSDAQCARGTSNNTAFPPAGGSVNWTCSGTNGGNPSGTCTAKRNSASALPDLTAGAITPTTAIGGSATSFSSTITNSVSAGTIFGFSVLFQKATDASGSNATDLNARIASPLNAGASESVSDVEVFSEGTYYMRACADKSYAGDTGSITESDENNNCGPWTQVTVGPCTPVTDPNSGICRNTHYLCVQGTPTNTTEDDYTYYWKCLRVNSSGRDASCNESKSNPGHTLPDLVTGIFIPSYLGNNTYSLSAEVVNMGTGSTGKGFPDLFEISRVNNPAHFSDLYDFVPYVSTALDGMGGENTMSGQYTFPTASAPYDVWYMRACANTDTSGNTPPSGGAGVAESSYDNNCSSPWTERRIYPPVGLAVTGSFWADSYGFNQGESTLLHWTSSPTDASCTGSGFSTGSGHPSSGQQSTGALAAGRYTYQVTCKKPSYTDWVSSVVVINVAGQGNGGSVKCSPSSQSVNEGGTAQWTASGGGSYSWYDALENLLGTGSSFSKTYSSAGNYAVHAESGGNRSTDCMVTVGTPSDCSLANPSGTLTASPSRVKQGGTTTLTWTDVKGVHTPCSIVNASGCSVPNPNNSCDVIPSPGSCASPAINTQTTFTLVCNNIPVSSATVDVLPKIIED